MATSAQQLSSSCQRIPSKEIVFSNSFGNIQRTAGTHYVKGTGSLGRLKYHEKHRSLDASDDELEYAQLSQSTHILGRVKSERLLSFNSDEIRRRRTIIVEKRNDSYGFTLQSYGIHYTRDQEIETITYVDYVEYDGPAYRSGMREGDVILSINGIDMEKADHKTLVAFIKSCDTRMRMVVLFEDCVRKVELHMRYIQLQSLLQNKINELECITLRERELLDGKWKTHSLPARKKTISSPTADTDIGISAIDATELSAYYRPTLSTEDVPNIARYHHHHLHPHQQQQQQQQHHHHHLQQHQQHQQQQQQYNQQATTIIPPPAEFRLTRHYARTPSFILKSSANSISLASSGEFESHSNDYLEHSPTDQQHFNLKRTDSTDTATLTLNTSNYNNHNNNSNNSNHDKQKPQPPQPPIRKKHQQQKPIEIIENNNSYKKKRVSSLKSTQNNNNNNNTNNNNKNNNKGSNKYCQSHTCNPCLGNFRWKSTEKAAALAAASNGNSNINGNSDNVSLDAYDLASPCCDTHCVPTRRRSRHQQEREQQQQQQQRDQEQQHTAKVVLLQQSQQSQQQQQSHAHKHKHREFERNRDTDTRKERSPRPKSQSHIMTVSQQHQKQQSHHYHHHHHHHHHRYGHNHQQQPQQHNNQVSPEHKQHQKHMHDSKQQLHACGSNGSGSIRSQYFDLATGLMSYCSLHSRTSSEFAPADSNSYTTSLSTDTLFWEPKVEQQQQQQQQQQPQSQSTATATATAMTTTTQAASSTMLLRQQSIKSRNSQQHELADGQQQQQQQSIPPSRPPQVQAQTQSTQPQPLYGGLYQHRYHITATQIQPSQICMNPMSHGSGAYVQKPRSWDNLTTNALGGSFGIGYGYGYLDTTTTATTTSARASGTGATAGSNREFGVGLIHPTLKLQIAQQRHSIPRKNPYGRFSAYATANVENYAPPPQQFVEEYTTTTTRTTTILAKSTEQHRNGTTTNINNNDNNANNNNNDNNNTNLKDQEKQHEQQQFAAFKMAQMKINQNQKFSHYNNCQLGYYSHLPRPTADVGTSTTTTTTTTKLTNVPPTSSSSTAADATVALAGTNNSINVKTGGNVTTISEVTRL